MVDGERVAQELRIAAEMQRALLPPPDCAAAGADLAAATTPCRDVGGDLFDYVVRSDGSVACVVADVAGKGTSAALLTAVVQGLFAAETDLGRLPADVLAAVNRALCRRAIAARFATAFYAHLGVDGSLRYCNAGHNPPFLVRAHAIERLNDGGTVLGLFENSAYDTGRTQMVGGEVLVMFSDGVTEAENAAGEEYGDERLAACLVQSSGASARDIVDAILGSLGAFCGQAPARDDVTVMVVKVR